MNWRTSVLLLFYIFLRSSDALSTTMIVYDGQRSNESEIQSCVEVMKDDETSVVKYQVDSSKTLEAIRSDICTKLSATKNLKVLLDYSRTPAINSLLNSLSQQIHLPHLRMSSAYQTEFGEHNYQLQLYPGAVLQLLVLKEFLHEERENFRNGLVILPAKSNDLSNFATLVQNVEQPLVIRKWSNSMDDNSQMLDEASREGVQHFIVGLDASVLNQFFALASSKQMLGYAYKYVLTNTEAINADLTPFAFSGANIYAFSASTGPGKHPMLIKLTKIAKKLTSPLSTMSAWEPRCSGSAWSDGQKAMSAILSKAKENPGLLNAQGDLLSASLSYQYNVLSLTTSGYNAISYWEKNRGFSDLAVQGRTVQKRQSSGVPTNVKVVTVLSPPFVIYRDKDDKDKELTGNDAYTGMSIAIFKRVAKALNLKYTISIAKDQRYGALTKGSEWNGMIGEVKKGEADIAVGDLTVTAERSNAVQFSSPYINLGVTVLMKRPSPNQSTIDFCAAFRAEVWVLVIFCLVLASLSLFVTARLSPGEWYNTNPTTKVNYFTLQDCFWFVSGAALFRGTHVMPRAVATRLVCLFWWIFILILLITYAVTIQAFIPKAGRLDVPFRLVEDLGRQTAVNYGALGGGSTFAFFQRSISPMYKTMYEYMRANPQFMVNSTQAGVERVKSSNGQFAFIMESALADYYAARDCDLIRINDVIQPRSFAFAFKKNAPLAASVSKALLKLQEEGEIERIKKYWLYQYRISTPCELRDSDQLSSLNAFLMTRLFVGLILGLIIAFIVCFVELLIRALRPQERGDKTIVGYLIARIRLVFCTCTGEDKEKISAEDERAAQPALSADAEVTDKDAEKA